LITSGDFHDDPGMSLSFVLIHSPLTGPSTWLPCADALRAEGHGVVVPSLATSIRDIARNGTPTHQGLADAVAGAVAASGPAIGPLVLVAHSGAGALLPSVAEAVGPSVKAAIFADATLPHPGKSWLDSAPPALAEQLRNQVVNGELPPWDQWFPPGAIADLLPDPVMRRRFLDELPTLPWHWFEQQAPVVAGWPSVPCGYLQLSAAYDDQAETAADLGWPTISEKADHLSPLTRPDLVAPAVAMLGDQLAGSAART
jgi:hypothetical protein